jgi:cystathionine beta-lyase/cystathionine gamma-synthase
VLYRKDFGGVLSPKNAWPILVFGLPTLAARMVNQQKSAMHDYIAEKSYTVTLAVSLGQIKTRIENPFSTTHASVPEEERIRSGLQPAGIRLSLGSEDWHDIIADLEDALEVG